MSIFEKKEFVEKHGIMIGSNSNLHNLYKLCKLLDHQEKRIEKLETHVKELTNSLKYIAKHSSN